MTENDNNVPHIHKITGKMGVEDRWRDINYTRQLSAGHNETQKFILTQELVFVEEIRHYPSLVPSARSGLR